MNSQSNTYFQYFVLVFSNINLTYTCSSTYCIGATLDSSNVTYISFKSYQGKKLYINTPLSNLSVADRRQCLGSCTKLFNCSSVNFYQNGGMANCELLSENAYTRVNELIDHVDWTHFTAYVRLKFYCSCIWGLKEMHNSLSFFFFLSLKIRHFMSVHYISPNNWQLLSTDIFHWLELITVFLSFPKMLSLKKHAPDFFSVSLKIKVQSSFFASIVRFP